MTASAQRPDLLEALYGLARAGREAVNAIVEFGAATVPEEDPPAAEEPAEEEPADPRLAESFANVHAVLDELEAPEEGPAHVRVSRLFQRLATKASVAEAQVGHAQQELDRLAKAAGVEIGDRTFSPGTRIRALAQRVTSANAARHQADYERQNARDEVAQLDDLLTRLGAPDDGRTLREKLCALLSVNPDGSFAGDWAEEAPDWQVHQLKARVEHAHAELDLIGLPRLATTGEGLALKKAPYTLAGRLTQLRDQFTNEPEVWAVEELDGYGPGTSGFCSAPNADRQGAERDLRNRSLGRSRFRLVGLRRTGHVVDPSEVR